MTAKDVAFTLQLHHRQEPRAPSSTYTKGIKKAEAVDDYTVDIICSKPKANMQRLWIYIMPGAHLGQDATSIPRSYKS